MSGIIPIEVLAHHVVTLGKPESFVIGLEVEQDAVFKGLVLHVPCDGFMVVESIRLRYSEWLVKEEDAFLFAPCWPPINDIHLPIAVPPDRFEVRMRYTGKRYPEEREGQVVFSVLARFKLHILRPKVAITRRVEPPYTMPERCPICWMYHRDAAGAGKSRWGRVFQCDYCGVDWKFPRYRRPGRSVGGHPRRKPQKWQQTYGGYSGCRIEYGTSAVRYYDINSAYHAKVTP